MNKFLVAGVALVLSVNVLNAQEVIETEEAASEAAALVPESADTRSRVLDEIIVSAQKRSETLQEVPAAISAIGGPDLEMRGIQSSADMALQIPNFNYSQVNGSALLSIRGVGLEIITGVGEPAVAMHIDGVYQPRVVTGIVGTYDLERVEVLRGPQGTLYGRNANAGAINFITKAPADEFGLSGHVGYGRFDSVAIDAGITGPLTDWLSGRFSMVYEDKDGYIENLSNGESLMDFKTQGARVALRATPLDDVIVDAIAYVQKNETAGPIQQPVTAPQFPSTLGAGFSLEPWEERLDLEPEEEINLWALTGIVEWQAPFGVVVKSITGYTHSDLVQFYDGDSTDAEFILVGRDDISDSFTEELNVSGTAFQDWSWGTLDWIAGIFYLNEDLQQSIPVDFPNGLVPLPPPLTTAITDLLGIEIPPIGGGPLALQMQQKHQQTTNSYAGFIDFSFTVADFITLMAGGRW
ncbi:MAG: TonB-dependent receptor, partial [Alphaproteobacteria bacterium]